MLHITFMKHDLFIIEGFDRIGKSTLLSQFAAMDQDDLNIYIQPTDTGIPDDKMPSYREDSEGFRQWLEVYLRHQVNDLLRIKDDRSGTIMARLFISDDVYSNLFNRKNVAYKFADEVTNAYNVHHIVLLWSSYETYLNRLKKCGEDTIEYTEQEFNDIQDLYLVAAQVCNRNYNHSYNIIFVDDSTTECMLLDKVVNLVEEHLGKTIATGIQEKTALANKRDKIDHMFELFWDLYANDDLREVKKYLSKRENLDKGIIIAGVGKNFYIAEKIYKTFISMGIKCQPLDCVHALHGDLGMVDGQMIFFLSKSGNTEEMVTIAKTLNMLRQRGHKRFVSCGFFLNSKPSYIDYDYMIVPSEKYSQEDIYEFDSRNLVPSLSINIMQMILDDLGCELFEMNEDLYEGYKYNHMGGTNGKRLGADKELQEAKTSN